MKDRSSGPSGDPAARLNLLRGVAILGVVAIHTAAHFTYAQGLSPVVRAHIVIDVFAHYAVPLFILLSGIALALRYGANASPFSARSFYARRLTKILPPYLVFSLFYLLLFAFEYGPPAPSWIPLALLTGSAHYHLWFVAMLIQLYLLFPLLRAALRGAVRHNAVGWLVGGALLLQLAWNLGAPLLRAALPERPLFETILSQRFFLSHLFYFLLGMAVGMDLAGYERRIRYLPWPPLMLVAAGLTALTALIWMAAISAHGTLNAAPAHVFLPAGALEPALFLATIALLWQAVIHAKGRAVDALAKLGVLSLPIYLVHVAWQWALARGMGAYGVTPEEWEFYVVLFAGTLVLSVAAAAIFARMPYGELLTGAPRKGLHAERNVLEEDRQTATRQV
jgi:surface polysaccharide O-acyltransferase-like enzyme